MQNAQKREECYTARDAFFECMEKKGLANCKAEDVLYTDKCPATWKNFFNKQHERHQVLEGQAELSKMRRDNTTQKNA